MNKIFFPTLMVLTLIGCDLKPPEKIAPTKLTSQKTGLDAMAAQVAKSCKSDLNELVNRAKRYLELKQADSAFDTLHPCRSNLTPEAKEVYVAALTQANAYRSRLTDLERKQSMAAKKRSGVHVGMSEQDVLDSNWGKPRKINRTTTANAVDEQWVYEGGYLYFVNGSLTAIQN